MKSWKLAIESMGFRRYCYEKQEHLHCMAFRKTVAELNENHLIGSGAPEMLYIPQDFTDGVTFSEKTNGIIRSDKEDSLMRDYFDELPGF